MYRLVAGILLLLTPGVAPLAQTAAQRLDDEPEARQIQGIADRSQSPQTDPLDPNRQAPLAQTAVDRTSDLREMNRLLDRGS